MSTYQPRRRTTPAATARGFTAVEALIVASVGSVAIGAALPGLELSRERRHVEGAASQFETDVAMARSLAVAQNRALRISFQGDAANGCYVVHTGAADACRCGDAPGAPAVCSGDAESLRTTVVRDGGPVALSSNVRSMLFDPVRGTVSPTGTVRVAGAGGAVALHQVVNIMGRVRTCSAGTAISGYRAC